MVVRLPPTSLRTSPRVSVVVPCYNYGHYLSGCLKSVLGQEGVDVDVIVVDDASPDDSLAVAQGLAQRHPRVQVIAHAVNAGHIATYNDGLRAATGDYVVVLSADDLLTPGSLSRATALLESDDDIAFVYGFPLMFEGSPPPSRTTAMSWSVWDGSEWIARCCARGSAPVVNPEVVMRRTVLQRVGDYDQDLPHAADMLLWLQAAQHGKVGRVNGCDQAYYRLHGANMHLTDYAGYLVDLEQRALVFEKLLLAEDAQALSTRSLLRRAQRVLAAEALRIANNAHDEGDRSDLDRFRDFAVAQWPGVVGTMNYRYYARRRSGNATGLDRRVALLDWRLRHIVRWRRWRRYGL